MTSPFFYYNANFDAQATMLRHARPDLEPRDKYLTNFLGVLIDPKYFPEILAGKAGEVEPVPIPANWHADIAEWAGALRAVELAGDDFTVMELGCGWGCWLNNTGVAARQAGKTVHLIGLEGDPGHIAFAKEACDANGFNSRDVTLVHGIAAATDGIALFPRQANAGVNWGLEPLLGLSNWRRRRVLAEGNHVEIPMVSLKTATGKRPRLDLLHIDIQGGEADLIRGSREFLDTRVAYVVVGTHSREIEGRIFSEMRAANWILEIERPAILSLAGGVPQVTVDGVQGWRNPRLLPL